MTVIRRMGAAGFLALAAALSACGGSDIGPGEKALLGEWRQSEFDLSDQGGEVSIDDTVVTYAADGTSTFTAKLVLNNPALPADHRVFDLDADVRWSLEETVLTRTLDTMRVTPAVETPETLQIAALYQQGLSQSPPGRFIVESVEGGELVLLDADNGQTLRFTR